MLSGKGGLHLESWVGYILDLYSLVCRLGTRLISTLSELTVNPLMVTGNVAEKRRICLSVGRKEINLSSACW